MTNVVGNLLLACGVLVATGPAGAAKLHSPDFFQKIADGARSSGYGANPPALKPGKSFCGRGKSCKTYCAGKKAIASKIEEAMERAGLPALVDPAVAIQDEMRGLGCKPAGGDARNASANCGIRFLFGSKSRKVQPSVVKGLARAAIEAGARGYSLIVGSTFRSAVRQTEKVCKRIANGAAKECGRTIACPGGSKHGMGFAIDVALVKNGKKVTTINGVAEKCAQRIATVKASSEMQTLIEIMFSAGWAWYCQELWHFEHTSSGRDSRIRTLAELGLQPKSSPGGSTAKASSDIQVASASGGEAIEKATESASSVKSKVEALVSGAKKKATQWARKAKRWTKRAKKKARGSVRRLRGQRAYITASSAWLRSRASSKSRRMVRLRRCQRVTLIGKSRGWREVSARGKRGHVYHKLVSTKRPSGCR